MNQFKTFWYAPYFGIIYRDDKGGKLVIEDDQVDAIANYLVDQDQLEQLSTAVAERNASRALIRAIS